MTDTTPQPPAVGRTARPDAHPTRLRDRVVDIATRRVAVTRRDVVVALVAALAVLVPSAAFGVATASADANLGPHSARYAVTLDGRLTLDLGPLGTVVLDSPVPVAGLAVTVREIPREIVDLPTATTLDALAADLDRYVQFFSAPEATVAVVTRALVLDALRGTLGAAALLTGLLVLGRVVLGRRRRAELLAAVRPHRGVLLAGACVGLLVLGTLSAGGTQPVGATAPGPPTAVFDGTALEGAVITGRLAGLVDTYGGEVLGAYRENEDFYARAAANLREEWAVREAAYERVLRVREEVGLAPARDPDDPEPVVALVVSDLHCNVGMGQVIRAVLEESGADLVLNAGDTTMNGTPVEAYCVTAFAQAARGVPVVVADGNHDSPQTAAQERAEGWTVLDGRVVEVAGIRIAGDADPRATRVGVGTVLQGEETVPERAVRLRDAVCADEQGVDIVLTHDLRVGADAVAAGCAPALVSGHYHRRIGPLRQDGGVRYVSSSTAGAALGQPTVGPLNAVAEMTLLQFDPAAREITHYQLVRVTPDTSVTVSYPVRWPTAEQPAPVRPADPDAPV